MHQNLSNDQHPECYTNSAWLFPCYIQTKFFPRGKTFATALQQLIAILLLSIIAAQLFSEGVFAAETTQQQFPDVLFVKASPKGGNSFDFDVTVSSPYDTPARYADAFRVMGKDGTVFGERELEHDHASEQPFTRDLYGVKIPMGVRLVIVQARDKQYGYGGKTVEVVLLGR